MAEETLYPCPVCGVPVAEGGHSMIGICLRAMVDRVKKLEEEADKKSSLFRGPPWWPYLPLQPVAPMSIPPSQQRCASCGADWTGQVSHVCMTAADPNRGEE